MLTAQLRYVCEVFSNIIKENKLRPITDFLEIYSKDGVVHLGMTDKTTTITTTFIGDEDIEKVVVSLKDLYKLLKLTITDTITLVNKGKYVEIKADGKYKLPIQVDEMGNDISLYLEMPKMQEVTKYNDEDFKTVLSRNKVGLYTGDAHKEFTLYYNTGSEVVTSDSIVVACTKNLFLPPKNIPAFVIEQLASFSNTIEFSRVDGGYRIYCNGFDIYIVNNIEEEFPIDMVHPFIDESNFNQMFPVRLEIDKTLLVNSIKRQYIFKNVYEIPTVMFEVSKEIILKNRKETAEEVLATVNSPVTMCIEVDTKIILDALKNMGKDISLWLGQSAICLQDDIGFYVISVIER